MWNPPIALTSEEQKIAARTRKTRKFFVFLREHRHEILDANFQHMLAQSYRQEPGGQEPVDGWGCWPSRRTVAGLLSRWRPGRGRADRDGQALAAGAGLPRAEQPPFSQGTLFNFRMRLIAHDLDKTLLDRTVALAEKTGGFGARQLRAVLDSTPLVGAGRVEDTLNLLGHALRKAVGLAAQELGTSVVAVREAAGLTLGEQAVSKPPWTWIGGAQRAGAGAGAGPGGGGAMATLAGAAAHLAAHTSDQRD